MMESFIASVACLRGLHIDQKRFDFDGQVQSVTIPKDIYFVQPDPGMMPIALYMMVRQKC
jgi:hypothetical protein